MNLVDYRAITNDHPTKQIRDRVMSNIVNFEELKGITGYKNAGDIEKCLRRQGIAAFYGIGKRVLWTTTDLINAAGGLTQDPKQSEPANKYI